MTDLRFVELSHVGDQRAALVGIDAVNGGPAAGRRVRDVPRPPFATATA